MLDFEKSITEFIPSEINISFRPSIKTLHGMLLLFFLNFIFFTIAYLWKQNHVAKPNLDNPFKQNLII